MKIEAKPLIAITIAAMAAIGALNILDESPNPNNTTTAYVNLTSILPPQNITPQEPSKGYCNSPCDLGGGSILTYEKISNECSGFHCSLKFNFSLNKDRVLTENFLKKKFKAVKGGNLKDSGFKIHRFVNQTKPDHDKPIYGDIAKSRTVHDISDFQTTPLPCEEGTGTNKIKRLVTQSTGNGTKQTVFCFNSYPQINSTTYHIEYNDRGITGYNNKIIQEREWNKFKPSGKQIKKDKTYTIELWGDLTPKTGENLIWLNITIAGRQLNLSWWNVSYEERRNITNLTTSDLAMSVNGTAGFAGKIIWFNPSQIGDTPALYNGTPGYAIANDTTEANYETEGGGDNNSITSIYSSDAIGVWHLDNSSGTGFLDSTSNNNDGTCTGTACPAETTGKYGGALSFDGLDDYVGNVGAASDFSFIQNTGIFTVSLWAKLTQHDSGTTQTYFGNTATSEDKGVWFTHEDKAGVGEDELRLAIYKGVPGNAVIDSRSLDDSIADEDWHHIVATGDGMNVRFYIDGVEQVGSGTMGSKSSGDSARVMNIGRYMYSTPGGYFNGTIDEVRIYNRALSAFEISEPYNNSQGRNNLLGAVENIGCIFTSNTTLTDETRDCPTNCSVSSSSTLTLINSTIIADRCEIEVGSRIIMDVDSKG